MNPNHGTAGQDTAEVARQLRDKIAAQFGRSLHIRTLDTGSCAVCEQEIRLLSAPYYDLHRLGFFFTPAPRHADLLLVTGPMVRAFGEAARRPTRSCTGTSAKSSRSTSGFPAARPARWPCCRG